MMYAFVYKSFEECCCDCNMITLMINLMYTIVYKVTEEDKTFDSLKCSFIFEMPKLNGFSRKIINWIKIF